MKIYFSHSKEIDFQEIYHALRGSDLNKKIICFYKKGAKLSSSLKVISKDFVQYDDMEDFINKLEIEIV